MFYQCESISLVDVAVELCNCRWLLVAFLPQDLRVETSKLVSCLCVTQTLIRHESDGPEKQLGQARQVGAFLAKTFGYSAKDLPASLKARFEEFGKQTFG